MVVCLERPQALNTKLMQIHSPFLRNLMLNISSILYARMPYYRLDTRLTPLYKQIRCKIMNIYICKLLHILVGIIVGFVPRPFQKWLLHEDVVRTWPIHNLMHTKSHVWYASSIAKSSMHFIELSVHKL